MINNNYRTLQIIVAFVVQVTISETVPSFLDLLGATLVFVCALVITFEDKIDDVIDSCKHRFCGGQRTPPEGAELLD